MEPQRSVLRKCVFWLIFQSHNATNAFAAKKKKKETKESQVIQLQLNLLGKRTPTPSLSFLQICPHAELENVPVCFLKKEFHPKDKY